jgi:hypothetical protein
MLMSGAVVDRLRGESRRCDEINETLAACLIDILSLLVSEKNEINLITSSKKCRPKCD